MLKEYHVLFKRLTIISDLCLVCVAFFLAFFVSNAGTNFYKEPGAYITLLPVLLMVWGILLYYFGMYDSFRTEEITRAINCFGSRNGRMWFIGLLCFYHKTAHG